MDTSLLPSTDNFFKYLLTIGLVALIFAFIYPVQNENKLKLEKIELDEAMTLDSLSLNNLLSDTTRIFKQQREIISEVRRINNLGNSAPVGAKATNDSLTKIFKDNKKLLDQQITELNVQIVKTAFKAKRIAELKHQSSNFNKVRRFGILYGVACTAFGLMFWAGSIYHDEKEKAGKNNENHTTYSYCFEMIKKYRNISLFCFIALIIATLWVLF